MELRGEAEDARSSAPSYSTRTTRRTPERISPTCASCVPSHPPVPTRRPRRSIAVGRVRRSTGPASSTAARRSSVGSAAGRASAPIWSTTASPSSRSAGSVRTAIRCSRSRDSGEYATAAVLEAPLPLPDSTDLDGVQVGEQILGRTLIEQHTAAWALGEEPAVVEELTYGVAGAVSRIRLETYRSTAPAPSAGGSSRTVRETRGGTLVGLLVLGAKRVRELQPIRHRNLPKRGAAVRVTESVFQSLRLRSASVEGGMTAPGSG